MDFLKKRSVEKNVLDFGKFFTPEAQEFYKQNKSEVEKYIPEIVDKKIEKKLEIAEKGSKSLERISNIAASLQGIATSGALYASTSGLELGDVDEYVHYAINLGALGAAFLSGFFYQKYESGKVKEYIRKRREKKIQKIEENLEIIDNFMKNVSGIK